MTSTLRMGEWGGGRERGVSECSGCPILIFLLKENWICSRTRHYAEPKINILLTRNLMILLHCLWAKLNNRTRESKNEYQKCE